MKEPYLSPVDIYTGWLDQKRTLKGGEPSKYEIVTSPVCYNAYTLISYLEMCDTIQIYFRTIPMDGNI